VNFQHSSVSTWPEIAPNSFEDRNLERSKGI
jgi:hypothetical protein